MLQLPEEYSVRLERLEKLKKQGVNPYPAKVERDHEISELLRHFSAKGGSASGGDDSFFKTTVHIVGRVKSLRPHGGSAFAHIEDGSGKIQIYLQEDTMGTSAYKNTLDTLDVGDFVAVTGKPYVTKRGEKSVLVQSAQIITKTLLPLPEKWHGLTDTETRFRKRYLDLIMNEEVKSRFIVRSKIISAIREFLDHPDRGFIEVETPTLQPVYGGGFARPFKTHHNAFDADFYLRISDEMYLKRLIVGGLEKVYEITKVFRNEGIDHDHNPEFTMFEAMIAYKDYHYGMDIIEEIVETAALEATGSTTIQHGETTVEVKRPWKRLRLVDAVKEIGGLDASSWKDLASAKKELATRLVPKKVPEMDRMHSLGEVIAFAFEELVEEKLIQPTIVYDYPIEVSPLAKKCLDPRFTERFEAFALGSEISNNYSELNDPIDLEQRFIQEKKKEAAGFDEAHQTDDDYLQAIKHGMPPTCGIALGIDRVVMLLTGTHSIKEVILFPTLRPEGVRESKVGKSKETLVAHAVILDTPDVPAWSKLNAAAHLSAALAAREGMKLIHMESSTTKDGEKIPMNIQHAIMMKTTSKRGDLLALKHAAEAKELTVTCFTEEMRDSSDDKKVKAKQETKNADEIGFLGVLVFGPKKSVEALTEKFALAR